MSPKERKYVACIELHRADGGAICHMRNVLKSLSRISVCSKSRDNRILNIANITVKDFNKLIERLREDKQGVNKRFIPNFTPTYTGNQREEKEKKESYEKKETSLPVRGAQIPIKQEISCDKYAPVVSEFLNHLKNITFPRTLRNAYLALERHVQFEPVSRTEKIDLERCVELLDVFEGSTDLVLGFYFDERNTDKKKEYILNQGNLNRVKKELNKENILSEEDAERVSRKIKYIDSLEKQIKEYETEKANYVLSIRTRINCFRTEMKNLRVRIYKKFFKSGNVGFYLQGSRKQHQFAVIEYSKYQNQEIRELENRISGELKNRYGLDANYVEIRDYKRIGGEIKQNISSAIKQLLALSNKPLSRSDILAGLHENGISYEPPLLSVLLTEMARKEEIYLTGKKKGVKYSKEKFNNAP